MGQPIDKVTVVGAGVIGLSTAIVLAELGHEVEIVADAETPVTTSDVAAAFWYPFHVNGYEKWWAEKSYEHFKKLSKDADAGVTEIVGHEYFQETPDMKTWDEKFWWKRIPDVQFGLLPPAAVPLGFVSGISFHTLVIHMPTYMTYLRNRFLAHPNASIRREHADTLQELLPGCQLLVNCTGLGARKFQDIRDSQLYECQGQVVVMSPLSIDRL